MELVRKVPFTKRAKQKDGRRNSYESDNGNERQRE
jgi:hypothetical protein